MPGESIYGGVVKPVSWRVFWIEQREDGSMGVANPVREHVGGVIHALHIAPAMTFSPGLDVALHKGPGAPRRPLNPAFAAPGTLVACLSNNKLTLVQFPEPGRAQPAAPDYNYECEGCGHLAKCTHNAPAHLRPADRCSG